MNKSTSLSRLAAWSAALLFPLTLLVSKGFELGIKYYNPDGLVALNQPLAYLTQIMVVAMITYGIIAVTGFVTAILSYHRTNSAESKLALKLLVVQLVITLALLLIGHGINNLI